MNTERIIDVSAVVTPNWAIDSRNQMSSHKTLQNPETKKKQKYQPTLASQNEFFWIAWKEGGQSLRVQMRVPQGDRR
jgi:hypothetical protein